MVGLSQVRVSAPTWHSPYDLYNQLTSNDRLELAGFHLYSLIRIQETEEVIAILGWSDSYSTGRPLRIESIQVVSPVVLCIGIGYGIRCSPSLL